MPIIFLDDVIISEENNGFSVEDFIGYVKSDTSFYMGFKHLRYYPHKYKSELNIFDKRGCMFKLRKLTRKPSSGIKTNPNKDWPYIKFKSLGILYLWKQTNC